MTFDVEWDPRKAAGNRSKHRVAFEEAATVFLDPRALTVTDDEHSEHEVHWLTTGLSAFGRLIVVCHTFAEMGDQRARIRIISSRKATPRERSRYEATHEG